MDFSLLHCSQGYPYKSWGHIHNQSATKISLVNKAHPAIIKNKENKAIWYQKEQMLDTHWTPCIMECHWMQWPGIIKSQSGMVLFFSHTPYINKGKLLNEVNARITRTRNLKSRSAGIPKITHSRCIHTSTDPPPPKKKHIHTYITTNNHKNTHFECLQMQV